MNATTTTTLTTDTSDTEVYLIFIISESTTWLYLKYDLISRVNILSN